MQVHANPPIVLNPAGQLPGLIVVDHAGITVPEHLHDLGLSPSWRNTHYFCDLGVAALAHSLAGKIDVPVVLCDVSRLVIDVNRWLDDPDSIPRDLEGTPIPANAAMVDQDRLARQEAVFWPYHCRVGEIWAQQTMRHARPFFFALHSCTRVFRGQRRPWDGGTIWNDDQVLSRHLLHSLGREPGLTLGDNKPYTGREGLYTVDRHTFGSGLPACGFEVANDMLETAGGIEVWADRLASALITVSEEEMA
ncbi:N-formylglutamate amidohydrolase [Rhodobacter lacus]|uniref:N-formylglutamate amidohydrolase n=1 Tax=Rhodobacter lacus TaxID=1641972 RepID=A0ABW5AB83_9RHOB